MEENQNETIPKQPQTPVSPTTETPSVNPSTLNTEKPKPKFPLALIIAVIVFILIAGSVAGFYIVKKQATNITAKPSPTQATSSSPTPDPTANWKIYTSDKYHFSVMYPDSIKVQIFPASEFDTFSFTNGDISANGVNIHIDPVNLTTSEDLKTWLMNNTYGRMAPVPGTPPPPTIYPYTNSLDRKVVGFWEEGGAEVLSKHVYIKKGNEIFEFSVHGLQAGDSYKNFPKAQVIFEKMISTFKLTSQIDPTNTWKTYISPEYIEVHYYDNGGSRDIHKQFSIMYPNSWQIMANNNDNPLILQKIDNKISVINSGAGYITAQLCDGFSAYGYKTVKYITSPYSKLLLIKYIGTSEPTSGLPKFIICSDEGNTNMYVSVTSLGLIKFDLPGNYKQSDLDEMESIISTLKEIK